MTDIFDESELNKRLAEEEAKFGAEPEQEEKAPPLEIEEKQEEPVEVETKAPEIEEEDEEERPTDPQGWKRLREKKKAAKAEAEEQKKLAETALKESQELRERLARLEGREEARAKPEIKEVDTDPEPDADLDPDLHIRWQLKQTNKRVEAAEKRAEYAEAIARNEGERRGLSSLEKEYVKTNKVNDYDEAIEHIKNANRELIKLEYPEATDAQINSHLEAERVKKAKECVARGVNPGEFFYKMAKALNYQAPKKDTKVDTKPNIDALNRNMGKNANLMGASNSEATGGVPTEKVVSMSIEQLLTKEGQAAMDAAVRREEQRMLGL